MPEGSYMYSTQQVPGRPHPPQRTAQSSQSCAKRHYITPGQLRNTEIFKHASTDTRTPAELMWPNAKWNDYRALRSPHRRPKKLGEQDTVHSAAVLTAKGHIASAMD